MVFESESQNDCIFFSIVYLLYLFTNFVKLAGIVPYNARSNRVPKFPHKEYLHDHGSSLSSEK